MAHGGTNFGFYNGANTINNESDYKPDLTSYDYDVPIRESGDVDNPKFKAIRRVVGKYSAASLPSVPSDNEEAGYGPIQLQKMALLFDLLDMIDPADVVESENPISMESVGQVHDGAQVFISCPSEDKSGRPTYVGTIERWSNRAFSLPNSRCVSSISLFVLGILSSVYLGGKVLHGWKMISIPFQNLNEVPKISPVLSGSIKASAGKTLEHKSENSTKEPAFYVGRVSIDDVNQVKDTYLSFSGWGKGIAFVSEFNIGRFWPCYGPQCNLYVPAPILRHGENVAVIFESESPNPELVVHSVDQSDFHL